MLLIAGAGSVSRGQGQQIHICRHRREHLLPPCAASAEPLLIPGVLGRQTRQNGLGHGRSPSSAARGALCPGGTLGTGDTAPVPAARENFPHGAAERAGRDWPGSHPGGILAQGRLRPRPSVTRALCDLGDITHGDMRASQEPAWGRRRQPQSNTAVKITPAAPAEPLPHGGRKQQPRDLFISVLSKERSVLSARPPRA